MSEKRCPACGCKEFEPEDDGPKVVRHYCHDCDDYYYLADAKWLKDDHARLSARCEALVAVAVKAQQDINWMLNNRQFLNADVFDYLEKAITEGQG